MEPSEETKKLIDAINAAFPQPDGGYTCAVFFHHDKDGNLKTMSPMVGDPSGDIGRTFTIKKFVASLLEYSHAIKTMASEMINKTLPKG